MKRNWWAVVLAVGIALGMAGNGMAQDKPQKPAKEKKGTKMQAEPVETMPPAPPVNENELIDYRIAEMLAGWQIGDTALMHSAIADDVMVVSGAYEPPIVGWGNFLETYQKLRARISSVQMDRRNTMTVVRGTLAWSSYQWEFNGVVDGSAARWKGQTTLVLEKRGGKWMIVHNHTSVVPDAPAAAAKP